MTRTFVVGASLLALVAAATAQGQPLPPGQTRGQPGANPPATSGPSVGRGGDTSSVGSAMAQEFVLKAATGGMFEIDSSKLAATKATDPAIKRFAEMMIRDHSEAAEKLTAAARDARIPAPPPKLEADQEQSMRELRSASGEAFDRKYIEAQRNAHADAVILFQTYAQSGDNPTIAAFARATLPILQSHKDIIDKMGQSRT